MDATWILCIEFVHLTRLGIELLAAEWGILRGGRLTLNVVDSGIDCGGNSHGTELFECGLRSGFDRDRHP